ncbi:MAG: prefoldin subunit [Nanoarchaeota archaeon]|nr:prefoldin subunit [Nanoarchaeota archaeon]
MDQSTIAQLQLLQQNLQNLLLQKKQLQNNLFELESALQEIKTSEKCYKILGHIMVAFPKDVLSKELTEKKEMNHLRLKNYLSQEEKLKRSIEDTQKEIMQEKK